MASQLAGCAGTGKRTGGDRPVAAAAATATAQPACGSPQACFDAGQQADKAKEPKRAILLFRAACEGGNGRGCISVADTLQDPVQQISLYKRACELDGGHFDDNSGSDAGCYNAAELTYKQDLTGALALYKKACIGGMSDACRRGGLLAYDKERIDDAVALGRAGCSENEGEKKESTCGLLGVLHIVGKGVEKNNELALRYLTRGCAAGITQDCRNKTRLEGLLATEGSAPSQSGQTDQNATASADADEKGGLTVADANIHIGSLTADGVTITQLACHTGSGGLFGTIALGPMLAKSIGPLLPRLRNCLPNKPAVRVRLSADDGTIASDASPTAASRCVESTLKSARAKGKLVVPGTCVVTIPLR